MLVCMCVLLSVSCATKEQKLSPEGFFPVRQIDVQSIDILSDKVEVMGRIAGKSTIGMVADELGNFPGDTRAYALSEYQEISWFFENVYNVPEKDFTKIAISNACYTMMNVPLARDCDFICFPQYSLAIDDAKGEITVTVSALACRIKRS